VKEQGDAAFALAKLCMQLGQYAEAKTALDEAQTIALNEFGPKHLNFAAVLQMQARLEREMGHPGEAVNLLESALQILKADAKCPISLLALCLNNLAFTRQAMGQYQPARTLFQEAIALVEHGTSQMDHQCHSASLTSLAVLYQEIDQDDQAEAPLRKALEIDQVVYGSSDPMLAASLNNLGVYLAQHGAALEGVKYILEAQKIIELALGTKNPQYATSLANLARLRREMGQYKEAEVQYVFALETVREIKGKTNPDFAGLLVDLGHVYACRGKFEQAEGALCHAIEIFEQTLPRDHQDAANARFSLFIVLAAQKKLEPAFDSLREAIASESSVMDTILRLGSEKDRLSYLSSLRWHVEAALSFVAQKGISDQRLVEWVFELVLRRKGLAAEALSVQRDVILAGESAELKDKFKRLNALKLEIARGLLDVQYNNSDRKDRLDSLDAERAALERELSQSIPEIGLKLQLEAFGCGTAASALPESGALIEFVRYTDWHFDGVVARGQKTTGNERYVMFVLRPGTPLSLHLVDLGEAAAIDQAVLDFRACLTGESERGVLNEEDSRSLADFLASLTPASMRLRRERKRLAISIGSLVLEPAKTFLDGVQTLLIVPDGSLLWLPFECLPCDDGLCIDRWQVNYLATSRDLLARTLARESPAATPPVVIADPDYDLVGAAELSGTEQRQSRDLREAISFFAPLNGTRAEGQAVAKQLGVEPLLGVTARESALKKISAPRILHIATHGFFFNLKGRQSLHENSVLPENIDRFFYLENPMLRAGLALAGANSYLRHGRLPDEGEDGILNAEDVSGLTLTGTELVVLSACETGLGELYSGEGVFGLRRAFSLAGARTLIVSLWKVADAETAELMEIFYERLLTGLPAELALREAKLALREKHGDPYYWAAFICLGGTSQRMGN
jgi:CHAT domain-containing protein/tetratricopeptide (TPR) repeat protein